MISYKEIAEALASEHNEKFLGSFENPQWRYIKEAYLSGASKAEAASQNKILIATKTMKQTVAQLVNTRNSLSRQDPSSFNFKLAQDLDKEIKNLQEALRQLSGFYG